MSSKDHNLSTYDAASMPAAERVAQQNYAIAVSDWNSNVTYRLLDGAVSALKENGAVNIDVVHVPGAFELSFAAKSLLKSKKYNAIIVLGAVVRGGTPHFDYVCSGVTQGITQLNASKKYNTPVIFGLLTTDDMQQALDRAGGSFGNKGTEAGITAIKMANMEIESL